ncbi:MAG: hypothetical protein Q4B09_05035 [Lachnospiraceae bacterium]|nr:hypothetical protein [Lachnospiraceae bacterium]
MSESIALIRETLHAAYPAPALLIYAVAAIVFLLTRRKTDEEKVLGTGALAVLLVFLFPPTALLIGQRMRGGTVYWRFLWLLPITVLLAYAAVTLITEAKKRLLRIAAAAVFAALLVFGGRAVYRSDVFENATSRDKLQQITMTTAAVINQHAAEVGNPYKRLMAPVDVRCEIRQFDATILSCVGRSFHGTEGDDSDSYVYFNRIIDGISPDYKHKIRKYMKYYESNYLLTRTSYGFAADLEAGGMEKIYDLDGWEIWYAPKIKNTKHADDFK